MKYIQLAESHCRSCLRCIRACPAKAVVYVDHRINILEDECILCGNCYKVCPATGIKLVKSIDMVKQWIEARQKVVLCVSSSVLSVWPDFEAFRKACLEKGFLAVEETIEGSEYVIQKYNQLIEKEEMETILSSTCPAVVAYIEKEYPDLVKYIAPIDSCMSAHAKCLRERYPDAKIVYLSTCVASQKQADQYEEVIDATLNVREMVKWIPANDSADQVNEKVSKTRLLALPGGLIRNVTKNDHYRYVNVDDIHRMRQCLEAVRDGTLKGYFIELLACEGGCITGPSTSHIIHNEWLGRSVIYASSDMNETFNSLEPPVDLYKSYEAIPVSHNEYSEYQIQDMLSLMGKQNKSQELNCGACGYDSCREKAIAVLDGKADMDLCMPYALAHARSVSNVIIKNTPNGVIVVDKDNRIKEINPAGIYHLHLDGENVIGMDITQILNNEDFIRIISNLSDDTSTQYFRGYYPEYGKIFDHAIMRVKNENYYVVILMDLTIQEAKEKVLREMRASTIEITQQVIDEQMRTVQEIASLLGETTAKSKVALSKLKKAMEDGE